MIYNFHLLRIGHFPAVVTYGAFDVGLNINQSNIVFKGAVNPLIYLTVFQ